MQEQELTRRTEKKTATLYIQAFQCIIRHCAHTFYKEIFTHFHAAHKYFALHDYSSSATITTTTKETETMRQTNDE